MRVLELITEAGVGGAQTHVRELAGGLARRGHSVIVAVGAHGPLVESLSRDGIEAVTIPELTRDPNVIADLTATRRIGSLLREVRPDVVHCHSSKAGLLGRIAARRAGLPSVYTAHGWPFQPGCPTRQRALSLPAEILAGHLGDAVICLTDAEADLARHWRVAPDRRLVVIPNGIPDRPVPDRTGRRDAPHLVTLTRLVYQKHPLLLVESLARIADVPWRCTIAGDGDWRDQVEDAIARNRLTDRIVLAGEVADPAALLDDADAFVLLSRWEGMPIAVIEAMRAGLAMVCTDLPGNRELLDRGTSGILTGNDADTVGTALRWLLTDPLLRRRLGEAARRRYLDRYGLTACIDATETLLSRVAHGTRR